MDVEAGPEESEGPDLAEKEHSNASMEQQGAVLTLLQKLKETIEKSPQVSSDNPARRS